MARCGDTDWCFLGYFRQACDLLHLGCGTKAAVVHENVSQRPPTLYKYIKYKRGLAQSGSASALGAEGRKFKSYCPDQFSRFSSVGRASAL